MGVSNVSNSSRPGICTSTTRPSAPYAGQQIYETDTSLSYIWGGSAWVQVAGGTAVGNSGLVFVSSTTIGTGVSSVVVSNAFNSTYDNYKIVVSGGVATNPVGIQMVLGASVTGYYFGGIYVTYPTSAVASFSTNNGGSWSHVGEGSPNMLFVDIDLANPFLAKFTNICGPYSGTVGGYVSGYHGVATSYSGFTLSTAGNTMTGGTITVYGYRKA